MTRGPRDDTGDLDEDRDRPDPDDLSAAEVASVAIRQIADLTMRAPVGATSVAPTDSGWLVEVEVIEDRRIPSSADMLAIYEVELTLDGELLSYSRIRRYSRGSSDSGRGAS